MSTQDASTFAHEIMGYLENIKDHGTSIDTGGGMGSYDLWVKCGGIEWYINVRKSNAQLAEEGIIV
jgi:hypothetical protein